MSHREFIGGEYSGTMAESIAKDIESLIVSRSWSNDDFAAEEMSGQIDYLRDRLADVLGGAA